MTSLKPRHGDRHPLRRAIRELLLRLIRAGQHLWHMHLDLLATNAGYAAAITALAAALVAQTNAADLVAMALAGALAIYANVRRGTTSTDNTPTEGVTMSRETMLHLNTNVLIGNTDQRGTAWHYRADLQSAEPNHYPGPIPLDDVRRRLFAWTADSRAIAVEDPAGVEDMTHLGADGLPRRWVPIPGRQAISRSDTGNVMGIFSTGYERHQYDQWLLTTVADILDDSLSVSSAGLLKDGAIAWVEVSVPESITTPQGVTFRPNLLATTSFDGSIATTFKRTITDTVCDDTRELALSERGQEFKIKHSLRSRLRLAEARDALDLVHQIADDFAAEVQALCETPVTRGEWQSFLDLAVPCVDPNGNALTGRALTFADTKRETLHRLYRHDPRVAPWAGTAHGVLQAINTYEHHEAIVRGTARAERNMLRTVTGDFAKTDRTSWRQLAQVLSKV